MLKHRTRRGIQACLRRAMNLLFLSLVVTSSLRAGEPYVPFRLADGSSGPARLLGFKLTADATEILPTVSKLTNETLVVLESLDPDKKPIVPRPFLFSEFAETTQRLIRSRNTTRLLAETRKAKLARLKNKSASHAAESLIRSYETFVKEGQEPATIKEAEFKRVLERGFRQLQTSDQREPLVQYLYALIRSQLDARGTSHRQLEALVRNYPHYWNARRALVYSVTNEESYISGAKELKKFHDELTRTLHAGNHSEEELKALLDEYFWVVDTAAVFEMKPKTKKLADAILEDPRSKQMITDAEDRLQAAIADQKQRAEAKAAEEEKRISSLVGRAKPLFDMADKEYRRKWDATLPLYQQAMTNYQLAEFRFQETYVRYRQTVANYEQISSRLRNARDKRTNASEDDRKLLDNEVDRLAREQTTASSQAAFAERTAGQANLFRMNAFQQMRGMSMQLQGIMVAARAFLFAFSREYFEAIEHDPELQGKYKILENTVAGMRQQLFALALKKQAKTKASDLLKEESRQVVGLLQFSPHRAILDLKEELKEGSAR